MIGAGGKGGKERAVAKNVALRHCVRTQPLACAHGSSKRKRISAVEVYPLGGGVPMSILGWAMNDESRIHDENLFACS